MPAKKKLIEQVAELTATGAELPTPATDAPPAPSSGGRILTDADLAADREFVASLDAPGAVEADEPEATATEDQTGSPEPVGRGGVNAMVTRLLADPALSYEAIVAQVVAAHPGAQTTARSVASTASVLRRKGTPVPMRRRGPKA
jgi:hypothetical protein